MSWLRRRMMSAGELPAGLTRVGWIQTRAVSGGTQNQSNFDFFDLGIRPTSDIEVEVVFNMWSNGGLSPGYGNLLGSRRASNTIEFQITGYESTALSYNGRQGLNYWPADGSVYWNYFSFAGNTLDLNGHTKSITRAAGIYDDSTYNIFLGCINQNNSPVQACPVTIKKLEVAVGGVRHNYIPCVNAQGMAGLYDTAAAIFIAPARGSYLIHAPLSDVLIEECTPNGSYYWFMEPVSIDFDAGESLHGDITGINGSTSYQRIISLSLTPFASSKTEDNTVHIFYSYRDGKMVFCSGTQEESFTCGTTFTFSIKRDGFYLNGANVSSGTGNLFDNITGAQEWYIQSFQGDSTGLRCYSKINSLVKVRAGT